MIDSLLILSQASQPAPAGAPPRSDMFWAQLVPIILMVGVFYWIMMRGGRKERQKHQEMLDGLKRNDRVQTIGGILGTVVDVRDNEVIVKVDENNNTKMRFARSAIKEVMREGPAGEKK
jgi:preprotein translocase subunit YajC